MNPLLEDAAARAARYLDGLDARPVAPVPGNLAAFDGPLPEGETPAAEVLALLDRHGSPATVASAGGRYFGFVTGGSLPAALAANWLASAWDQNSALWVMSPVASRLEATTVRWLGELFGLPASVDGGLVTGTTMANVAALAAARHALLARAAWDVESRGLFGAPALRVVVGAEAHASLKKALALVGLGRDRVEVVVADGQGRMLAEALPPLDERTILCLQAGNVNSGASDPFEPLIAAARSGGAWVHVDGAFGLWAAASPAHADQVRGVGGADSWATDLHKWLNVPYDSGVVLVRDGAALRAAMGGSAAYLIEVGPREGMHHVPDSSRRARGADAWAALRSLGRSGVAALVERCCRHARRFAERLEAAGAEILNQVVLNQVVVAFGDDERTARVVETVQRDGTCWAGTTRWQGRVAMRISVSSWATTERDVELSADAIERAMASG
ncbi:MAG: aspartate aminotransferase family protein [Gemmatimonadales bacterium]